MCCCICANLHTECDMHLSREIAEVVGGVLVMNSSQEKRLVRGVSRNKRKMARSEIKNRKGEKKLKRI